MVGCVCVGVSTRHRCGNSGNAHTPHTSSWWRRVEMKAFALRVVMACICTLVYDAKWQSGTQLLLSCMLTYQLWYWQPQLEGWANHIRTGSYASVAWCALLYVITAFNLGEVAPTGHSAVRPLQ